MLTQIKSEICDPFLLKGMLQGVGPNKFNMLKISTKTPLLVRLVFSLNVVEYTTFTF